MLRSSMRLDLSILVITELGCIAYLFDADYIKKVEEKSIGPFENDKQEWAL